ncbi:MAG: TauD/TfdA family dioxygenase [Alphaproteobacteria bacterium]|nr:TauD/TfdA family dioxygenase [Alphaproteobacteria bacterium]
MGAEIFDLDLSQPLDADLVADINDAFLAHHVLVFRDQSLPKDAQVAFSENFGELESHVHRLRSGEKRPALHVVNNLDENGMPTERPRTTGNYFWHTDKSYHAVPSLATLLYAVELPPSGGDTLFANTKRGYETLSAETKQQIADLRVEHSWEASRLNTGNTPATEAEKRDRPPVVHPLVRTHPNTGAKTLYVGMHTSHILDMPEDKSRALLDMLVDHTTKPELVYRHQWRMGDLVMWDNRCLLHRADKNYDMAAQRRLLHRTVIKGSLPF